MGDRRAPSRGFLTTSRKSMGRYGQFGNVRFGSLADVASSYCDVRFTPGKRTLIGSPLTSAKCQKQTWRGAAILSLFDHLVGASEQRRWDGQTERLRSLEIDN